MKTSNETLIIAGFAGIGKTTLAKKYKNVIDIESTNFKWDNSLYENLPTEARKGLKRPQNKNWPINYIEEIKNQSKNYDILLVWIHPDTLDIYDRENINYTLCFPTKESLPYYKARYENRGNNIDYINKVIGNYDIQFDEFNSRPNKKIILNGNETLEDYLIRNNFLLIKN